jgi:hypothetical protein
MLSCAQSAPGVFIRQILAPSTTGASGSVCTYVAAATEAQLSAGLVDAGLRESYRAVLLVGSQIASRASTEQVRVETSQLLIEGAEVHVLDAKGNEMRAFTRLASATIEPSAGTAATYGTVTVDILDAESIRQASAGITNRTETHRVIVQVLVFGHTLGGGEVESAPYQFPVDVCVGCLVSFKDAPDEPTLPGVDCKGDPSTVDAIVPCFIGQDQPVSCSACQGIGVCELE